MLSCSWSSGIETHRPSLELHLDKAVLEDVRGRTSTSVSELRRPPSLEFKLSGVSSVVKETPDLKDDIDLKDAIDLNEPTGTGLPKLPSQAAGSLSPGGSASLTGHAVLGVDFGVTLFLRAYSPPPCILLNSFCTSCQASSTPDPRYTRMLSAARMTRRFTQMRSGTSKVVVSVHRTPIFLPAASIQRSGDSRYHSGKMLAMLLSLARPRITRWGPCAPCDSKSCSSRTSYSWAHSSQESIVASGNTMWSSGMMMPRSWRVAIRVVLTRWALQSSSISKS
mmetsp:Transcript_127155/g.354067  ORF Transcript_127155/g.354067 Transcript_127155/m.354067 type:complete len:280 (-) Transcript_127155:290-1129(-)